MKLSAARAGSLRTYASHFRTIVSEIHGTLGEHTSGPTSIALRAKVDALSLESITPRAVIEWKNQRIKKAGVNNGSAIVSVNSMVRNAKSLFTRLILPHMREALPTLPELLPFDGVSATTKTKSLRYVSKMNAEEIIKAARVELEKAQPKVYLMFLLAVMCGLRRSEIDNLLWRDFDFEGKVLKVTSNEYKKLKSVDSEGDIDLDENLIKALKQYKESASGPFVIGNTNKPANERKSGYRCDRMFRALCQWLRDKGITTRMPIHTLRKEIGSIIYEKEGLLAASRFLRHADIRITAAIYVGKKTRVSTGLDHLLRN